MNTNTTNLIHQNVAFLIDDCDLNQYIYSEDVQKLLEHYNAKNIILNYGEIIIIEGIHKTIYLLDEHSFLETKEDIFSTGKDVILFIFSHSLKAATRTALNEQHTPLLKLLDFRPVNDYGKSTLEFLRKGAYEHQWIMDLIGEISKGLLIEIIIKIILR